MSAPILVNSKIPRIKHVAVERGSTDHHPSVWGDYFIRYAPEDDSLVILDFRPPKGEHQRTIEGLVAEVEAMLLAKIDDGNLVDEMNLIDQMQRLGIAYHFEALISERLDRMYENNHAYFEMCGEDLHTTALLFRLLRQQGYRISCGVFSKFKTGDGFQESLQSNLHGLLSLYEASHFMVHGEDILEEANAFTTAHLKSYDEIKSRTMVDDIPVKLVRQALRIPIGKGFARLEASLYIPIYRESPSRNNTLYSLVVLNFNSLQQQHQQELGSISRWWKNLDLVRNLPFVRDRIAELYLWTLSGYFQPEFALGRRILTKVMAMISVIDDIYDDYGTMEELKIFTLAVERWDRDAGKEMPEGLKWFYNVLLDVYETIYQETTNLRGQKYRHDYAILGMKELVNLYQEEAKWYHQRYVPPLEEYLSVTMPSSTHHVLFLTTLVGMGDEATESAFKWVAERPKILRASEFIARVMDDIAGHMKEKKRGQAISAVECYMKEHGDISAEEAKKELYARVLDAWKDINEGCLRPNPIPMTLLTRILNLTKILHVVYDDTDHYTHPETKFKEYIRRTIAEPLVM